MIEIRSIKALGLGGNLPFQGSPTATTLVRALRSLASEDIVIRSVSRFFETPCFPAGAGPDYVNAAVLIETALEPVPLLHRLHEVEAEFDRSRAQRWGMRTLDIDLLAYGQRVEPDAAVQKRWMDLPAETQIGATPDQLILPHPRLQDRPFALVPMLDIAPEWEHPVLRKTVRQLCAEQPKAEIDAVRPI